MSSKTLIRIMYLVIGIGLVMIAVGVSLILFTDIPIKQGVAGIMLVAGLIAGGLFLSLPAKLYLTLQLMRMNDERLHAERQHRSGSLAADTLKSEYTVRMDKGAK